MSLIIDASQALAWLFADEASELSDDMLMRAIEEEVVVPPHWWLEVANGALTGERRGRSTPDQTARWREQLELLDAQVDDAAAMPVFERIMPSARTHRLTIYDALYLELAARLAGTLVSQDADLTAAAGISGIAVVNTRRG